MRITKGTGLDVVHDGVGHSTFVQSLKCLRRRGLLALYGAASGPVPPLDLLRLSAMGSLFITRPISLDYVRTEKELVAVTESVFSMFMSGDLNVPIGHVYALQDAGQAHKALESRRTTGKPSCQLVGNSVIGGGMPPTKLVSDLLFIIEVRRWMGRRT